MFNEPSAWISFSFFCASRLKHNKALNLDTPKCVYTCVWETEKDDLVPFKSTLTFFLPSLTQSRTLLSGLHQSSISMLNRRRQWRRRRTKTQIFNRRESTQSVNDIVNLERKQKDSGDYRRKKRFFFLLTIIRHNHLNCLNTTTTNKN